MPTALLTVPELAQMYTRIRNFICSLTRTLQTTPQTMKIRHSSCTSHAVRMACHAAKRCFLIRQLTMMIHYRARSASKPNASSWLMCFVDFSA